MSTNREAAEVVISALREVGRLETVDEALVAAFLTLASAVDEEPAKAALWSEYRAFEHRLRGTGGAGDVDDDLVARMSAAMGDPTARGPANQG